MAFLALIYTAAWLIIGLPGAVIIGLLTGLFNIVPELGPFMAGMLAVVIGLFEGSNYFPAMNHLWYAVLILGVYLALNYFKTVYLQPRILGRNVELHEGLVFVAIIVALMVSGILGVLIIVPGIASIIIIGRYLRARILGQPPFQPRRPIIRPPKETPMKKNLRPVKVPRLPKRKD
jgi:predicted PurR-regulated permease PerM